MTDADNFGIYWVYAQMPIHEPSQQSTDTGSPNTNFDSQANNNCRPGTAPNQGSLHLDTPYYHLFSNPLAAAMMLVLHSGISVQSLRQTTQITCILRGLGSDLNPLDLSNFDAAVKNRKLDAYLTNATEAVFHCKDGWQESLVRI